MTTAPKQDTQPAEAIAAAAQPAEAIAAPVGGLSLRKNFSWTFVGNVVYAACQWGILVVLAKLGTPEMVGQFALGLAVTAPVMMFSTLQLRGVQATDAKREYQFGDYLALRLITTALALAAIGGIVALGGYRRETALVILIIGALKGIDALSDVYYGLWQQHERMDGIAQALMLNGVLSTAALTAIMAATHNIVLATLGTAVGSVGALMFTLARNRRLALVSGLAARPNRNAKLLWRLTRLAMPLGVAMLLVSVNTNIPRYFIAQVSGEAELGIFAAVAYLLVAGNTVIISLAQSATSRLGRLFHAGDNDGFLRLLRNLLFASTMLSLTGILISIMWGHSILKLIYGPEYSQASSILTWLMIAALPGFACQVLGFVLLTFRTYLIQAVMYLATTVVTVFAATSLIPRYHLEGAAWVVAITYLIQLVGSYLLIRKGQEAIRRVAPASSVGY